MNADIKLRLLTNGMLLTNQNVSSVYNKRIKWGITFDAFTQNSLEGFQKGVIIEKVKENVVSFVKCYGGENLYLNFTITSKNISEVLPFCMFAIQNGINEIYLTELKVFSSYEKDLEDYALQNDYTLEREIDKVKEYLTSHNVSIDGINIGRKNDRRKCYIKNISSPMIDVDGSVSFCSGREDEIIGNIFDKDIVVKWREYVKYIEDNNINWCEKCYDKKKQNGIYYLPNTIRRS